MFWVRAPVVPFNLIGKHMTLTIDKTTTSTSINLIDVLYQVQDLDKYRDYKAVTLAEWS